MSSLQSSALARVKPSATIAVTALIAITRHKGWNLTHLSSSRAGMETC